MADDKQRLSVRLGLHKSSRSKPEVIDLVNGSQESPQANLPPVPSLPNQDDDDFAFDAFSDASDSRKPSSRTPTVTGASTPPQKTIRTSVNTSIEVDEIPVGSDRMPRNGRQNRGKTTTVLRQGEEPSSKVVASSQASGGVRLPFNQILGPMQDSTARAERQIEKMSPMKPSLNSPSKINKSAPLVSTTISAGSFHKTSDSHYEGGLNILEMFPSSTPRDTKRSNTILTSPASPNSIDSPKQDKKVATVAKEYHAVPSLATMVAGLSSQTTRHIMASSHGSLSPQSLQKKKNLSWLTAHKTDSESSPAPSALVAEGESPMISDSQLFEPLPSTKAKISSMGSTNAIDMDVSVDEDPSLLQALETTETPVHIIKPPQPLGSTLVSVTINPRDTSATNATETKAPQLPEPKMVRNLSHGLTASSGPPPPLVMATRVNHKPITSSSRSGSDLKVSDESKGDPKPKSTSTSKTSTVSQRSASPAKSATTPSKSSKAAKDNFDFDYEPPEQIAKRTRTHTAIPTVIELSDDDDNEEETTKSTNVKLHDDALIDSLLKEVEENRPKSPILPLGLAHTATADAQRHFDSIFYQDDQGFGHVSADADSETESEKLCFDGEITVSLNRFGICFWRVSKPPPKVIMKASAAKSTSSVPSTPGKSRKASTAASTNMSESPAKTIQSTPDKSKKSPKKSGGKPIEREMIGCILKEQISAVDVYIRPCLFFIHTTSDPDNMKRLKELDASQNDKNPQTAASASSEQPSDSTASSSFTTTSGAGSNSSKKRLRIDELRNSQNLGRKSPRLTVAQDSPHSATDTLQDDTDNKLHHIREAWSQAQPSQDSRVVPISLSNESLELSYDIDHSDQVSEKMDITMDGESSTIDTSKSTATENSPGLFILCCRRQNIEPILELFKALSQPVSEGEKVEAHIEAKDHAEKSSSTTDADPIFTIHGRDADRMLAVPEALWQHWYVPKIEAAEDKTATPLKSPTKLKPVATPINGTSLPQVVSKKKREEEEKQKLQDSGMLPPLSRQAQSAYCKPFSIGDWSQTMELIQNKRDEVRETLFAKVWPICVVLPSLRGLFHRAIKDAPPLFVFPSTKFFHQASFPQPMKDRIHTRSELSKITTTTTPKSDPEEASKVLTFPPSVSKDKKDEESTRSEKMEKEMRTHVGSVTLYQNDVDRLAPGVFLNDSMIDFYLIYLQERLMAKKDRKRVMIFSTHFYTLLDDHGLQRVAPWVKKAGDLFSYDFIIVPINLHLHWKVAVICNVKNARAVSARKKKSKTTEKDDACDSESTKSKNGTKKKDNGGNSSSHKSGGRMSILPEEDTSTDPSTTPAIEEPSLPASEDPKQACILVLDSLGSTRETKIASNLRSVLAEEAKRTHRPIQSFDISNLPMFGPKVPLQTNYTDCGLFLLHYMELFCLDLPNDLSSNFIRSELMGEGWFPESDVLGKRAHISEIIASLVRETHQMTE